MSQAVSISIRKVKNNILLGRKQFIVDVFHPEKPSIPKKELQKRMSPQREIMKNPLLLN